MAWIALDRIGTLPYVLCGICSVVYSDVQYGTTVLDTNGAAWWQGGERSVIRL